MKQEIFHPGRYILLFLFLLCFGYILSVNTEICGYNTPVIYSTDEASFSSESVKAMREEAESGQTLSWTAVQTLQNQSFSNENLNREASGVLLLLNGNSANLISATGELTADDLNGCILSTEAAWELFGETEVSGGEISCNGDSYEVRGVYEDSECVVLLPADTYYAGKSASDPELSELSEESSLTGAADTAAEAEFDKIVVSADTSLTDAQRSETIETFEAAYAVGEDKTDCLIYRRIAVALAMSIPTLLLSCIVFSGMIRLVKIRRKIVRLAIGFTILAVMTALFFILFQIRPSIPADLIPNTWSDFDFWKDKLTEFSSGIRHLLYTDKTEIERNYFRLLVRMSVFTGMGIILFILTVLCFRGKKNKDNGTYNPPDGTVIQAGNGRIETLRGLLISLLITCIAELTVILLLNRWGVYLDGKRFLIYLWPYFLVSRYAVSLI